MVFRELPVKVAVNVGFPDVPGTVLELDEAAAAPGTAAPTIPPMAKIETATSRIFIRTFFI